jgi:agmatine deiminase
MAWPCRAELWNERLGKARAAHAEVARAIAAFEPVSMIARPEDTVAATRLCGDRIEIVPLAIDDSWMRDSGPTFLRWADRAIVGCAWRFNAWGGKYSNYANDATLAPRLLERLRLCRFDAPFVLEGGAIHCDGAGTVLTTESVLLNQNRNPGIGREAMEALLREWIGARQVIWLPGGLTEDETDGHVDNVACFAAPGVVLAQGCSDPSDADYDILRANLQVLRSSHDAAGRPLRVVTVEQPEPRLLRGARLPRSYVNFYVANGVVVMPAFGCRQDSDAAKIVADLFPGREIVQVRADPIVVGGGGIHCITQQQPAI